MKKIILSIFILTLSLVFTSYGSGDSVSDDPNIVAVPIANLSLGEMEYSITINLTCPTAGAEIWYTTDGTIPIRNGSGSIMFAGVPITITANTTIKAIAVKDNMDDSAVLTVSYTVSAPKLNPDNTPTILFIPF